jgi:ankyrin repeat protein
MRFFSEQQRRKHPLARQIPLFYWNKYFNNEWLPIHETLWQISSLEDCAILNLESDWDAKKLQSFLVCILANNKAISLNFWQQFLEQRPHILNDIFVFSACFGHLNILSYLWNYDPERRDGMIAADNFSAFLRAAANGHDDILEQLKKWTSADKLQKMIAVDHFFAFRLAAENGHLEVLKQLHVWAPTKLQNMIEEDDFSAFKLAAKNGHLEVLEQLKQWAPNALQNMIAAKKFLAFQKAAENGQIDVLRQLNSWAPTKLQNMIDEDDFLAFRWAAENGHEVVLRQLQEWVAADKLQKMIEAEDFFAFRLAAKNGHLVVLKELKKWAPSKLQNMIAADNFLAFRLAAKNGHLAVLKQFKKWAPDELQNMIAADNFSAFPWVVENGHLAVLEQLKKWAPGKLTNMIAAEDFFAVKTLTQQQSALLKDLINTQEGISLLLSVIDEKTGQSALMKAIEDTLILNGKELNLQIFTLTNESLKTLKEHAEEGNLHAQYLLVKWDTITKINLQKSMLDYRWLAANEYRGACYDIKRYADAGSSFFQCIYYSLGQDDTKLINLLLNDANAREFFFLTEFDFLHEAVALDSHDDYIHKRLVLLENMEQQLAQNHNKEKNSELEAWVYCLRVLFAIQAQQQIKEEAWAQNPVHQAQNMISLLVIHYNQYQTKWFNAQQQDFIKLLVTLSNKGALQPPVLRDFNRILIHHLCGNEFGITFTPLTKEQQSKLIALVNCGKKTDGEMLNNYLGCPLTYPINLKGREDFYSRYNFFLGLPDVISNDEDKEYQNSSMQIEKGETANLF